MGCLRSREAKSEKESSMFMILGLLFLSQVLFHDTHLLSLSCVYYGYG